MSKNALRMPQETKGALKFFRIAPQQHQLFNSGACLTRHCLPPRIHDVLWRHVRFAESLGTSAGDLTEAPRSFRHGSDNGVDDPLFETKFISMHACVCTNRNIRSFSTSCSSHYRTTRYHLVRTFIPLYTPMIPLYTLYVMEKG